MAPTRSARSAGASATAASNSATAIGTALTASRGWRYREPYAIVSLG